MTEPVQYLALVCYKVTATHHWAINLFTNRNHTTFW